VADRPAVRRDTVGPVVVLTMDRHERGNTLDVEVLDGLLEQLGRLRQDGDVHALVLTGAGKHFSLGGALDDFGRALSGGDEAAAAYCRERTDALAALVLGLRAAPFPVVAAINGQAAGAGFSLALACDLRIVSERARLHFAYGALGASTDGGMSWLLPRVVGPARALALLLDQPIIRPARALQEGLVTEVVPAEELPGRALALAARAAHFPRHSVSSAKRLVYASASASLAEHLQEEHRTFTDGILTEDMKTALASRHGGTLPVSGGAP
jgi:enoyl-CoA hydratase/carnithine racemase